jgi:hypothetical protein
MVGSSSAKRVGVSPDSKIVKVLLSEVLSTLIGLREVMSLVDVNKKLYFKKKKTQVQKMQDLTTHDGPDD